MYTKLHVCILHKISSINFYLQAEFTFYVAMYVSHIMITFVIIICSSSACRSRRRNPENIIENFVLSSELR